MAMEPLGGLGLSEVLRLRGGTPKVAGASYLSSEKVTRSFHIWKTRGVRPKASSALVSWRSAPEWPWPGGLPVSPLRHFVESDSLHPSLS